MIAYGLRQNSSMGFSSQSTQHINGNATSFWFDVLNMIPRGEMAIHDNNGDCVGCPYSISLSLDSNEKSRTSIPPQNVEQFFSFLEGNFLFETLRELNTKQKNRQKRDSARKRRLHR